MKISYNGVNLSRDFECFVTSRPMPEFIADTSTVPGLDGEEFGSLTIGTRECEIQVIALDRASSEEIQQAARTLMAALAVREPSKLVLGDEKDRDGNQLHRLAVPIGSFDMEEFVRAGRWTLRFKQFDPYLHGKSRSMQFSGSTVIETGGNAESWPVIESTPTGSSYTISGNGKHVTYAAPFNGSTRITMFTKAQTCRLSSDIGGEGIQVGSRFFPLQGTMTLSASSPTTISWDERWL